MTMDRSYQIFAQWGARAETPEALADRFLRTVDALGPLHPLLKTWTWGDFPEVWESDGNEGSYPFDSVRPSLARSIERNVSQDEGTPDPPYGYAMPIQTDRTAPGSLIGVMVNAGSCVSGDWSPSPFVNYADVEIGLEPDPSLFTFEIWRSIMLILVETWEATFAEASPWDIRPYWTGTPARLAWMNYVSPRFAPLIDPPPSVIVELRPNGGLFLAATDDIFKTDNPTHMAAARTIEAALQPLNKIPFPIDDPYR